MLSEINGYYNEKYEDFDAIKANTDYKLFRLELGVFNKFLQDHIEIKDEGDDAFDMATDYLYN